jgi:alpha-tubulin suppressor-like RCC1 family protein
MSSDNKPILVDFTGVAAISAGDRYSVALKNDGTVWAWGKDNNLYIGNTTPTQVTGLSEVDAISAGGCDTIVLKKDGTVWGWGANANGELGDGQKWNPSRTQDKPVQALGISGVVAIAAGDRVTYALKNDGSVWAWGANWSGELGNGTTTISNIPVQVTSISGISAISAKYHSALALKNDGTVWAWGSNGFGQLGDGTIIDKSTPVQVRTNKGEVLTGVVAVAVGNGISSILKNDGSIWTWGYNLNIDGTPNYRLNPVQVNVK